MRTQLYTHITVAIHQLQYHLKIGLCIGPNLISIKVIQDILQYNRLLNVNDNTVRLYWLWPQEKPVFKSPALPQAGRIEPHSVWKKLWMACHNHIGTLQCEREIKSIARIQCFFNHRTRFIIDHLNQLNRCPLQWLALF